VPMKAGTGGCSEGLDMGRIPRRAVGAGAPSGLQNRREASRSPVRSIRTALRQTTSPMEVGSMPQYPLLRVRLSISTVNRAREPSTYANRRDSLYIPVVSINETYFDLYP
jgi:hypothetical protein